MNIIDSELNIIKKNIEDGLCELLPNNSITDFVLSSGKMVRSKLALLYYLTQEVNLNDEFYNFLSAIEILHNASLLHDDVLDEALIRRGRSTIAKDYSEKISILAGDYLVFYAFEKLLKTKDEIKNIFEKYHKDIITAEINQFFNKGKITSEEEYIKICKGKTATLFIIALEAGAINLSKDIKLAQKFGEIFGIAFQIKNDLEKSSAEIDSKNKIYTAKDILGIEKTNQLLDNYKEEMLGIIKAFPNNLYKKTLEDLIINLCTIERS